MARKTAPKTETTARGGKRIVTTRDELPLPPESGTDDPEDEFEEQPSELDILVAEFGGNDFEFAVFRMDPKAARGRTFAGQMPGQHDSFSILTYLQENFGGGTYELRVREPGGQFSRRITVAVEQPKKPEAPPAQQMQEQMSAVINAAMAPMLQLVEQMKQQKPQFNFNELLTKGAMLIPLLGQARAALGLNTAPVAPASDPLTLLTQMKQMKDTMDAMGLSDREPDGVDRLMTLFQTFKPMIEKAAASQLVQRPRGAARPAAPVAAGAMPVTGVPTVPLVAPTRIPDELALYVPILAAAARNGETVESVSQRILGAIPDNLVDPLADALEDGSLVSALLLKPEFAGMQPWLNALAQNILAALSSEEETEEEPSDVSGTGIESAADGADED